MGDFLDIITGKKSLAESIKTEDIGTLAYSDLMQGYLFVDGDRAYVIQTQIIEHNVEGKPPTDLKSAAAEYHVLRVSEIKPEKPAPKKRAPLPKKRVPDKKKRRT